MDFLSIPKVKFNADVVFPSVVFPHFPLLRYLLLAIESGWKLGTHF